MRNTIFTEYERQRSLDMEPIERAYPLEVNPYHQDFRQPFYQESAPQQTYQWQAQHVQEPHRPRQSTWFGRRRKRDVTSSSHPISSTISDQLLMSLVDELNSTRRLLAVTFSISFFLHFVVSLNLPFVYLFCFVLKKNLDSSS